MTALRRFAAALAAAALLSVPLEVWTDSAALDAGAAAYTLAAAQSDEPVASAGTSEGDAKADEAEETVYPLSGERESLRPAYYMASDEDLLAAENKYTSMEANLQFTLENYELLNPGYDEYVYEFGDIGHDPYVLLSLLSAYLNGFWTIEGAQEAIEEIFSRQYTLTETVSEEMRYETATETRTETDPETGKIVIYVEGSEVPYTATVCTVTLEVTSLNFVPSSMLTRTQLGEYASYMSILGGAEELFPDSYYQKYLADDYQDYEVNEEYLTDPVFSAVLNEAEKYLGWPYVWGGSYPDTGFDCSGFVCNALNAAGYDVGRTSAQGLYELCTEVSEDELRPGDLVFFSNTYDSEYVVTHVAIYVGDGMIINAGDPVQYESLEEKCSVSQLYAFGRLN